MPEELVEIEKLDLSNEGSKDEEAPKVEEEKPNTEDNVSTSELQEVEPEVEKETTADNEPKTDENTEDNASTTELQEVEPEIEKETTSESSPEEEEKKEEVLDQESDNKETENQIVSGESKESSESSEEKKEEEEEEVNAPPGQVDTSDVEGKTEDEIKKEIEEMPEEEQEKVVEAETQDEKEEREEFEEAKEESGDKKDPESKEETSVSKEVSSTSPSSIPTPSSGTLSLNTTLGDIASVISSGIIKNTQANCDSLNQNGNEAIVKVAQEMKAQRGGKKKQTRKTIKKNNKKLSIKHT